MTAQPQLEFLDMTLGFSLSARSPASHIGLRRCDVRSAGPVFELGFSPTFQQVFDYMKGHWTLGGWGPLGTWRVEKASQALA